MDATTAQIYKHRLVRERDALLAQIDVQHGGRISRAEVASESIDKSDDDAAQIQTGRDLAFAIHEHETAELVAKEASLKRIQAGGVRLVRGLWHPYTHGATPCCTPHPALCGLSNQRREETPPLIFQRNTMSTFHAVVWMDHAQAHVLMFDKMAGDPSQL